MTVKWMIILFSLAALSLTVWLRLHLAEMPLERDEGEYAYMGQQWLQGVPPYLAAANMKLPGTYAVYSLLFLLGQSPRTIHLGFLLIHLITSALVFWLARRRLGVALAAVAGGLYCLAGSSPTLLGQAGHATHLVNLWAVLGLAIWDRWRNGRAALLAGTALGIAFLMKQPGVMFILAGLFVIALAIRGRQPLPWKVPLLFLAGAAFPILMLCGYYLAIGHLKELWFWTMVYAVNYGARKSFVHGYINFTSSLLLIFLSWPIFWLLAAAGLVICIKNWRANSLWLIYMLGSAAALSFGLYFRPHYFLLVLPAAAILAAICLGTLWLQGRGGKAIALAAMVLLVAWYSVRHSQYLASSPAQACKLIYGDNPFIEAQALGAHIRTHSDSEDAIAVLGSEPELYFYSQRRSAIRTLYAYELVNGGAYSQRLQQEVIQQIEDTKPKYLVLVNMRISWLIRPESNTMVLDWFQTYWPGHYRVEAIIDIVSHQRTNYTWQVETNKPTTISPNGLILFKRID